MALLLTTAGCSSIPVSDADPSPARTPASALADTPEDTPEATPEEHPVAAFEGDTLYQLLVAEVAGHRRDYQLALEHYVAATRATRDPGLAARATRLALYMKDLELALETAMIWAEADPLDVKARHHLVDLLLNAGRLEAATVQMEAIKNLGGTANFEILARHSRAPAQQQFLLGVLSKLLARHPDAEDLQFTKAVLLTQTGDYAQSLALTGHLLESSDKNPLVILQASNLQHLGRAGAARELLEASLQTRPEDRSLLLTLAQLLFEQEELDAARAQYLLALENSANDGDILLPLALIALEQQDDATAKRYLERLLRWHRRPGEAHYYLGTIAERHSDLATAMAEYKQAEQGYVFPLAQMKIATLLTEQGNLNEARAHLTRIGAEHPDLFIRMTIMEARLLAGQGLEQAVFQVLGKALEKVPDKVSGRVELLYFRAMMGQRFGHLDIFENNLRQLISLDPDNAEALNALGYTLTDETDRHAEALVLIEKALALKPEEAAFIDSLGWVHYRLQNYTAALRHLQRAFALFPNDEIAAHLGEVLWILGDHGKANAVWDRALESTPDSSILRSIIQRFRGP